MRIVDAAELLAVQRGHLWLAVNTTEGSSWREALLRAGFRPQSVPPGEPAEWLVKPTPLREEAADGAGDTGTD